MIFKNIVLYSASAFLLSTGSAAFSPETAPGGQAQTDAPAAPQVTPIPNPTNEQIHSFASAVVDLSRIQREVRPQIEDADAAAKAELQQQAQQRMIAAVERHGIDTDTFNGIAVAAEHHEALAQQINEHIYAMQAGRTGR